MKILSKAGNHDYRRSPADVPVPEAGVLPKAQLAASSSLDAILQVFPELTGSASTSLATALRVRPVRDTLSGHAVRGIPLTKWIGYIASAADAGRHLSVGIIDEVIAELHHVMVPPLCRCLYLSLTPGMASVSRLLWIRLPVRRSTSSGPMTLGRMCFLAHALHGLPLRRPRLQLLCGLNGAPWPLELTPGRASAARLIWIRLPTRRSTSSGPMTLGRMDLLAHAIHGPPLRRPRLRRLCGLYGAPGPLELQIHLQMTLPFLRRLNRLLRLWHLAEYRSWLRVMSHRRPMSIRLLRHTLLCLQRMLAQQMELAAAFTERNGLT